MRKQTSQLVKLAEYASFVSNGKFSQVALTHTLSEASQLDRRNGEQASRKREGRVTREVEERPQQMLQTPQCIIHDLRL